MKSLNVYVSLSMLEDQILHWMGVFSFSASFVRMQNTQSDTTYPCLFALLMPNLRLLNLMCSFQHIGVVFSATCAKNMLQDTHVDLAGASIDT